VVVSEYALYQLECKCLVEVLVLVGIAVALRQTELHSHAARRVARSGTERLCRRVRKSYRFKFILRAIFLYKLVDDKHDPLVQSCHCRGRHHRRPGFM
jgi:hypothetical protein